MIASQIVGIGHCFPPQRRLNTSRRLRYHDAGNRFSMPNWGRLRVPSGRACRGGELDSARWVLVMSCMVGFAVFVSLVWSAGEGVAR